MEVMLEDDFTSKKTGKERKKKKAELGDPLGRNTSERCGQLRGTGHLCHLEAR